MYLISVNKPGGAQRPGMGYVAGHIVHSVPNDRAVIMQLFLYCTYTQNLRFLYLLTIFRYSLTDNTVQIHPPCCSTNNTVQTYSSYYCSTTKFVAEYDTK